MCITQLPQAEKKNRNLLSNILLHKLSISSYSVDQSSKDIHPTDGDDNEDDDDDADGGANDGNGE